MEIQQYLKSGKSLDTLAEELGIVVAHHDTLPLVILNYSQIDSPKTHPIVRECRGLVLEKNSWNLVARAFPRFYNWGEVQEELQLFNWNNCHIQAKEDGSLGLLFYYQESWRFNTRGSFADSVVQFQNITWTQLFCNAIGVNSLNELNNSSLNKNNTYVFELVSPYTQVVRQYPTPAVYLLTVFQGKEELDLQNVNSISNDMKQYGLNVLRPHIWNFSNIKEVEEHVYGISIGDKTFEGVVIRDDQNRRWKVKSGTYVALHRMRGDGDNLFNPKHQLKFILMGEVDEVINYFPIAEETIRKHQKIVESAQGELEDIWKECWQIEEQKEFALAIVPKTKFASVLFTLRKQYGKDQNLELLRKVWRESDRAILKILFNK